MRCQMFNYSQNTSCQMIWQSSWSSTLLKQRSIMIIERQILPQLLTELRLQICFLYLILKNLSTSLTGWQVLSLILSRCMNRQHINRVNVVYCLPHHLFEWRHFKRPQVVVLALFRFLTQHLIVRQMLLFLNWATNLRIETIFLFTTVLTTAGCCGFTITTLQRKMWMSSLRTHNWTRCTVIWVSRTQINDLISCMRFHITSVKHWRSRNEPHRSLKLSLLMMRELIVNMLYSIEAL